MIGALFSMTAHEIGANMARRSILPLAIALLGLSAPSAFAAEYPIGTPHKTNGIEVAAVYLQPIEMEPAHIMRAAAESDVHLEADIHALADNKNGFAEGDWIPNLKIEYTLVKIDGGERATGVFMPMVASDGPHYGDNVKLMGAGKYKLTFTIKSLGSDTADHFGRHVDKETGVGPWAAPFSVDYEFTYAGTGKKGAY